MYISAASTPVVVLGLLAHLSAGHDARSPRDATANDWAVAHGKAQAMVNKMTLEEKSQRSPSGDTASISTNIDDKALHEVFLWPFQDAVRAGSVSVMCSYQRVNQTYTCASDKAQNGALKGELGFRGFVVSDWGALYGGLEYATGGLDMGMPNAATWDKKLVQAVQNGSFAESRVTDMATRIIAAWYHVGQDKRFPSPPGIGMPKPVTGSHLVVEGRDLADRRTILQGAIEGHVLAKNERNTLPLRNPKTVSIFGYSANTAPKWSAAEDTPPGSWSMGLAPVLGVDISKTTVIGPNGTLYSGGGSGAVTPATFSSPQDALVAKAARDGFTLHQDLGSSEPVVKPSSEACIISQDDYTDTLIKRIADQRANTIVVLHNAGIRTVDGFVDHPNVTALLFAHLPGEDSGEALVSLLWGHSNPSGKLPYTVAHSPADYGALLNPHTQGGRAVNGAEAAQLYVRIPGTKAKQLRGFTKQFLKVGEKARVSFSLTRRDLSVWDTGAQKWLLQKGRYEVFVGMSSAKVPLRTSLVI
ncbi:hypothetical protein E4U09_000052 [Claviceps aff. purpurea]|uniref:beta-glucosidase n=1 Tax=Claviceps aff. purpurea TaxID=1967640 RepID=A0A9P7QUA3_9HYPO|nr:hypothetical protein E4U09_000052 [Claviceps aff. purpurea]